MSTNRRPYPVAHRREDGALVIEFGVHAGETLAEVPLSYLRWMCGAGKTFLPRELLDEAADELHRRSSVPSRPAPDRFDGLRLPNLCCGEAVMTWIEAASAGDLAEAIGYTMDVASVFEEALQEREQRAAGLLAGIVKGCDGE
jgi:hypothetical protein